MTRAYEVNAIFRKVDESVKNLAIYTAIIISEDSISGVLQHQFACFQSYSDAKEWLEMQYSRYSKVTPVQCYIDDSPIFF